MKSAPTPTPEWFAQHGSPQSWLAGDPALRSARLRWNPGTAALVAGTALCADLFSVLDTLLTGLISVLLAIIAVVAIYGSGLDLIARWAWHNLRKSSRHAQGLIGQGLPLLLVLCLFSFLASELWQTIGRARGYSYTGLLVTLFFVGVFFISRGKTERLIKEYPDRESLRSALRSDAHLADAVPEHSFPLAPPPLCRAERQSLFLMEVVFATIFGFIMAAGIAVVLLAVAFFTVDLPTTTAWVGKAPYVVVQWRFSGTTHVITSELLHVIGFISVFAGVCATANAVGSTTVDETMMEVQSSKIEKVLAARAILAATRSAAPEGVESR